MFWGELPWFHSEELKITLQLSCLPVETEEQALTRLYHSLRIKSKSWCLYPYLEHQYEHQLQISYIHFKVLKVNDFFIHKYALSLYSIYNFKVTPSCIHKLKIFLDYLFCLHLITNSCWVSLTHILFPTMSATESPHLSP